MEPRGGRSYGAALVALVVVTMALAAASLTVIFGANGAFPVQVFGAATVDESESAGTRIRGQGAGSALRGLVSGFQLPDTADLAALVAAAPPADPLLAEARRLAAAGSWQRSLALYDRAIERAEVSDSLLVERARVLSWSGDALAAGAAMREVARRSDAPALRVEAAQFFWWGGDAVAAEELLSEARALGAAGPEVIELSEQVRGAVTPTVAIATRWVAERGGWEDHLALARAYVVAEQWPEALGAFDRAIATGSAPDSVYLELAATAAAADSASLSIAALREYLHHHPADRSVRLSLARAYSWAERYDAAIAEYEAYLAGGSDPDARFELAQVLAWTNRTDAAAVELRRAALARPTHAPTYRLLGDLARWRGDYELAIANYRYASDLAPGDPEIALALDETETEYARSRMASMPIALGDCAVLVESFSDSEGFTWTSTRGSRAWATPWGRLAIGVHQELSGRVEGAVGERRLGGLGVTAALRIPVSRTASIDLLGGTTDYGDFGSYLTGGLGIELRELAGATVSARYGRQPALTRAATIAALEAGVTSDLLAVSVSRPVGDWSFWSGLEAERLASDYGITRRYGANLSLSRPITSRVSVAAGLSAIGTTGDSPRMPDGRALYWTPELYLAPSIGVTYAMPIGERWKVAGTVTPGWAYVRERSDAERRFAGNQVPTLGGALEVAFRTADWQVGLIGRWGGSAAATGYRSSTLQLQGTYNLGQP